MSLSLEGEGGPPPGTYCKNMDEEEGEIIAVSSAPPPDTAPKNDDDHASWVGQFFQMVGGGSWTSQEEEEEEEQANNDEKPPSPAPPTPETKQDVVAKSVVLQRARTVSTILDSGELFSDDEASPKTNSSLDLYHDGTEGWEVVLGERGMKSRLAKYTRHPHFVKRCSLLVLVMVALVVLVGVLCGTLGGNDAAGVVSSSATGSSGDNMTTSEVPPQVPDNTPPEENEEDDSDFAPQNDITNEPSDFNLEKPAAPFSTLDPVEQLGMFGVVHSRVPPSTNSKTTPTNAWYENLIHGANSATTLTNVHKAYTVPYIVDAVGPIAGLRSHPVHLDTSDTMVQLQVTEPHGLTLGVSGGEQQADSGYSIVSTNPLGLTLEWNALGGMTSSIIRGMPYSTMHYPKPLNAELLPTIAAQVALQSPPVVDGNVVGETCSATPTLVDKELQLTFVSDYTWVVFFSEPVMVKCVDTNNGTNVIQWQVVQLANDNSNNLSSRLTIRAALLTSCTNGTNAIYCNEQNQDATQDYLQLLSQRANIYPGPNADVRYGVDTTNNKATIRLDWDARDMTKPENDGNTNEEEELFMYALPHHLSRMTTSADKWMPWNARFCVTSLIGSACAVSGSIWDLDEDLPIASFRSPRPPRVDALPAIASALAKDIDYVVPANFQRGAGDTYFSGKVLARVARVLLIHEELEDLCNGKAIGYDLNTEQKLQYMNACRDLTLPSDDQITTAMDMLRRSVQVWINGTAEARFAYDSGWGGVINCGCLWDQATQGCSNTLPDCPATSNQGLNFGNGYYNDHHFHYGYHVYAAAALTHFDYEWGRQHFEDVLLLIRDYANPSDEDVFFPRFRNKDWYQGSSWASGITEPIFGNIMNQESTSEAIAGYEAVALFGKEMMMAWNQVNEPSKVTISRDIRDVGLVTAATEIRSTDYYWHIRRDDDERNIYPAGYRQQVVGILWATMAQFTTWFGNQPYLIYGIQLLPLTPIAENRDASQTWLREMYTPLANSCASDAGCTSHGWSVLQLAILATIGHVDTAMQQAQYIPDQAFDSPGGNGHSMTNTLHYFATRPFVEEPAQVATIDNTLSFPPVTAIDCGVPQTCTPEALSIMAAGYTCLERITWLMDWQGMDEAGACDKVARAEYPNECGACIAPEGSNTAASAKTGDGVRLL